MKICGMIITCFSIIASWSSGYLTGHAITLQVYNSAAIEYASDNPFYKFVLVIPSMIDANLSAFVANEN